MHRVVNRITRICKNDPLLLASTDGNLFSTRREPCEIMRPQGEPRA